MFLFYVLVRASDEVIPPDQIVGTCQGAVTSIQDSLSQAGQRILYEVAQGVLHVVVHHVYQSPQLGHPVHFPGGLIDVVRAFPDLQ